MSLPHGHESPQQRILLNSGSASASSHLGLQRTAKTKQLSWWDCRQARNKAKGQVSNSPALQSFTLHILQHCLKLCSGPDLGTLQHSSGSATIACHRAGTATEGAEQIIQRQYLA